ncbi:hypothetical protein J6590_019329 [Homalodisca vitripennis]|nr:hypothetical protein J6590_019329 [Homalodisca vitripennis]
MREPISSGKHQTAAVQRCCRYRAKPVTPTADCCPATATANAKPSFDSRSCKLILLPFF